MKPRIAEKEFLKYEKFIFLKRCISKGVILPSNDRKGVDLDLLLLNQERSLAKTIDKLLKDYANFKKTDWKNLPFKSKNRLFDIKYEEKLRLKNKFK